MRQYGTATGKNIGSEIMAGIILCNLGEGSLKTHLVMNAARFPTYEDLRSEILNVRRAEQYMMGVPAPMDVSAVSKGDGKGTDAKKRNTKCFACGKMGHVRAECRSGGKGKGKGKGKKGQGKGKDGNAGSQKFDGACNYCQKYGHRERDCEKKKKKKKKNNEGKNGGAKPINSVGGKEGEKEVGGVFLKGVGRYGDDDEPKYFYGFEVESVETRGSSRIVSVGIDSGAGVTVWPADLFAEYPTKPAAESQSGVTYRSAGQGEAGIRDQGQRIYDITVDGKMRKLKARIAKVHKRLLSVSEMNDAGHDVHFMADGRAYAVHSNSGETMRFTRRRGVCEIDVKVAPCAGPRQTQRS